MAFHTTKPGLVGITTENMDAAASGEEGPGLEDVSVTPEAKMKKIMDRDKGFVAEEMKMKGVVANTRGHTDGSPS